MENDRMERKKKIIAARRKGQRRRRALKIEETKSKSMEGAWALVEFARGSGYTARALYPDEEAVKDTAETKTKEAMDALNYIPGAAYTVWFAVKVEDCDALSRGVPYWGAIRDAPQGGYAGEARSLRLWPSEEAARAAASDPDEGLSFVGGPVALGQK